MTQVLVMREVLRDGTVVDHYADPSTLPVPGEVTNFQARAALLQAGLFDQVNAALLALPVASEAHQAWEYANTITRHGALVTAMAGDLGFTAQQLDDLFRLAATIEA